MRVRFPTLATWFGVTVLLVGVACSGSGAAAGGEPSIAPSPDPTVSDPDAPVSVTPTPPSTEPTVPAPAPVLPSYQPVPVVEVRAQIVSADLAIAESFPPQYFVGIVSAQPNGCMRFSRFEVERHGTEIEIKVWNTVPKDLAAVLCTAVYSTTQSNVPLGSDFESGTRTRCR